MPAEIFIDRELAPLESISEYLKDTLNLSYHEIAVLVGRDDRTIWTCYNRAKKKRKGKKQIGKQMSKQAQTAGEKSSSIGVQIPISIFQDRTYAPLEMISKHLKEAAKMNYHQIAALLNRDDRTIWTCYNRATQKAG